MKCPNCQHIYEDKQVKCASCGQVYGRSTLEGLNNLEYLAGWLDEHQDELAAPGFRRLRQSTEEQLARLRQGFAPPAAAPRPAPVAAAPAAPATSPARPAEQVVRDLALATDIRDQLPGWVQAGAISPTVAERLQRYVVNQTLRLKFELAGRSAALPQISQLEVIEFAQQSLADWKRSGAITPEDLQSLLAYLHNQRTVLAAPVVLPGLTVPAAAPPKPEPVATQVAAPVVPPKAAAPRPAPLPQPAPRPAPPPRPPFNWTATRARAWQLVVSGALLRGLLYLGALMIVASAVVLVVRFWNQFPGWLQIGFVAAVPMSFYAGGFVLRRLKIPVAGSVFTGIGALLVAVDLAGVYQLAGLSRVVDLPIYWLISSVFCAGLYLFTLYRARGEFFGYLTLIGGGNVAVALAVALRLAPEWWVAAGGMAGLGMVAVAGALKNRTGHWPELARPARYFSQLVLPAAVFMAAAVALFVTPYQAWAVTATLAVVALGYGGLAWAFDSPLAECAGIASSCFAAGFAFNALGLPAEWATSVSAISAAIYSASGRWLDLRRRAVVPDRRAVRWAWYAAAGLLAILGLVLGLSALFTNVWAGVIGLLLLVALLAGWAWLFRKPVFTFAAVGLFIVPFTAAVLQWLAAWSPLGGWVAVAWVGLALGYLALAVAFGAAPRHALWLNVWAHLLTGLVCFMAAVVVALTLFEPASPNDSLTALLALSGAIAVYALSAVLHDSGRQPALSRLVAPLKRFGEAAFLWPISPLLAAWLAVAWWRWALPPGWAWFGALLAGLGLAYVGLGQALARRRASYRLPFNAFAYLLAAGGVLLALGEQRPLTAALYLTVATLAALAVAHRRPLETFLAAALFVAPFQLTLNLAGLPFHAAALAYALLATLTYYPLGLGLRRVEGDFSWPVLSVGYALAAAAVALAVLGPLGWLGSYVPGIAVAAPLVVLVLLVLSSYHLRQVAFAWAAAIVLPIVFWQVLNLLNVPAPNTAAAWVGLAFVGLLIERSLARVGSGHWLQSHRRPQQAMAVIVCALGLGLTATSTVNGLAGLPHPDLFPAILAQALSVGFAVLAARLHHSRWPLYAGPVLAFFPVTLFFIASSARLFGQSLTPWQYGLVWMGLALTYLLAAALLDRSTVRYSHGLFAGGYGLALAAVIWSTPDHAVQLVVLGAGVLAALASQALAHAGRHHSLDDLIAWVWPRPESIESTLVYRGARAAFLFVAAYAFPAWLALLLTQLGLPFAWRGLGLVALAPIYIGLGLLLRRVRPEYAWPLYSAGYALTMLGTMVTGGNEVATLYALALAAAVYGASAFIFKQVFWLYLTNVLAPVIAVMVLDVNGLANAQWFGSTFMALAVADVALAQFFERGAGRLLIAVDFAMPFLAPGYVLSALALASAASVGLSPSLPGGWSLAAVRELIIGVFSAGVALYAFSAWRYRSVVFLYLAAWLAAVPYYLAATLLPIAPGWLGLSWLPLIVGYILGARLVFHRSPMPAAFLSHRAMPFYLLAYGLSLAMMAQSLGSALTAAWAFGAAAAIYSGSALLFRRPAWLFPGLLAAHLAVFAALATFPSAQPAYFISQPMAVLAWVMAVAGFWLERRASGPGERDFLARLLAPWAQPFLVLAAADVVIWQIVGAASFSTGLWVASSNTLLIGLLAMLWLDRPLAYATLGLLVLSAVFGLGLAGVGLGSAESLALLAALGFIFYLAARLAGFFARLRLGRLWEQPLAQAAIVLAAAMAVGMFVVQPLDLLASAAVLALAGAQAIGEAYRLRRLRLGYVGVALLLAAWVLALINNQVAQPQWYALPAGLYLMAVGFLERRIGRKPLAVIIESLGLAVLLVTTFSQSLDGGAAGLPYFILLIVEGMAVFGWGALRRLKSPFFIGLAANAINVLAQLVLLFTGPSTLIRWLIIGGTGLFIVATAVFVERQRERLIFQAQVWRETLAAWD